MCKGWRWCCEIVLTSTTALWLQFFHLISVLVSLSLKFHFSMFHFIYCQLSTYIYHVSILCMEPCCEFQVMIHVLRTRLSGRSASPNETESHLLHGYPGQSLSPGSVQVAQGTQCPIRCDTVLFQCSAQWIPPASLGSAGQ